MIAGKPKAGKSTMARQLAACIAKGEHFLERATKKSEVLYFANEEIGAHVAEHFGLLGITNPTDGIYTVKREHPGSEFAARLTETLKELSEVRLVIIDPLAHFTNGVDLDNYGQVSQAMQNLIQVTQDCDVAIIAVHHTKKRVTEEAGDAVLGSIGLMGAVATTILLDGELGKKRNVRSSQRYGTRLEYTQLEFFPETRTYHLGETCTSLRDTHTAQKKENRADKALMHIRIRADGITEAGLLPLVGCSTANLKATLLELMVDQDIVRSGSGKKGSPYVYSVPKDSGTELDCQSEPVGQAEQTIQ